MPKISYLVSTYDSGRYLNEHLHNLLQTQTDTDLEVVIVNPNSPGTDGPIAEKWAGQDDRVNYIYHDKREWYGESWLRAWKAAKGKFVCNSNTDDYHAPRFNEVMYKHMGVATSRFQMAQNEVAFGYAGIQVIDPNRQLLGQGLRPLFDFEKMTYECGAGPQVCWRNDDEFVNNLDWGLMALRASQYRSAFDYWLWLYFMSLGYHGLSVQELLTVYTQRPDSIENRNKHENNWETYASIAEFFPHHMSGQLKHAREFADFDNLPPREDWVATMQAGKKWRVKNHL